MISQTTVKTNLVTAKNVQDFVPRGKIRESEIERLFNTLDSVSKQTMNLTGGDSCLFIWTDKNKRGKWSIYKFKA